MSYYENVNKKIQKKTRNVFSHITMRNDKYLKNEHKSKVTT